MPLVPGADGYRVYLKDLTTREVRFRPLPWPLSPAQDPWTVSLLTTGDPYAIRLRACKGIECGASSKVAMVTAP